jgi:hypothetical protein
MRTDASPTDGPTGADGPSVDGPPGAPIFLSFGTNTSRLTEGESVRFVAVLSDTVALQNLVGGHLTDPSGVIQYGAFVADEQGAYSLDLSWAQLNHARAIEFAASEVRTFRAEFFDISGTSAARTTEVLLHCNGVSACAGECVDLGTNAQNCGVCRRPCSHTCMSGSCLFTTQILGNHMSCNDVCAGTSSGATCAASCSYTEAYNGFLTVGGQLARGYETSCSGDPACQNVEKVQHTSADCSLVIPEPGIYHLTNDNCCCKLY